jgi:sterol desaturase/sphingolipid hydroxylase (fatty acid hydroxylase superfamily)
MSNAACWVPAFLAPYDVDVGQQALYDGLLARLVALAGGNLCLVYVMALTLSHSLPTILINGAHYALRLVVGDAALEAYRWQSGRHPPPELVRRCILYVGAFHLLAPLLPYLLYDSAIAYHPTIFTDRVPGILTLFVQFIVAYFFTDMIFYWGHRALHTPFLYRHVHKQHHQFYVSIGLAAEYAHPIELVMGNIIPVMFPAIMFRYQLGTLCTWMLLAMTGTTFQHSGFGPPVSRSNQRHDFHHSHVVCNFGSLPFWDHLCGTNKEWLKYLATTGNKKQMVGKSACKQQ